MIWFPSFYLLSQVLALLHDFGLLCLRPFLERDFLEGFMAAIWVNTSEEKSLKNSSLKHHNHDLGKTPSSYRFWWNSWSISCSFRGDVLAISLVCPGAPLANSSSFLVNVCWVYLFKYLFATVSGWFSGSPDLPVVFSSDHRIIRCMVLEIVSKTHVPD